MCVGKNSEHREAVPTAASSVLYLPCKAYQTLGSHSAFVFPLSLLVYFIFISIPFFFYVTWINQKIPLGEAFFFHEDCKIFDGEN